MKKTQKQPKPFGWKRQELGDGELPANLIADWQEDGSTQDNPFPSYARLLKQNGTPEKESRYSWTIDLAARDAAVFDLKAVKIVSTALKSLRNLLP